MKIFLTLIILFITSCSSTNVDKTSETQSEIDLEIASLKDDDFRPVSEIRYNERADYHNIGDLVSDALKDETLAKIEKSDIKGSNDHLTGIAGLCHLGQTNEGLTQLDKIYPKYKSNPAYWNQMANCYLNKGEHRKAKIFYNKALSLDKDFVPAINNLGIVYLKERKDEKAFAAFTQAIALKKNVKTAQYNLANMYIRYGLFDEAEEILSFLLRSDSSDKDVLLSMSYVSLYKGDAQGALNYLSKVPNNFLSRLDFSFALLFSYKLSNSENVSKVSSYLKSQNLNSEQVEMYNNIMRL